MNFIKKYIFIIIMWIAIFLIIILWFGSGRLFMIFPAVLATIGYYLLLKGIDGKNKIKNINKDWFSNMKEGFSIVSGKIESQQELLSFSENQKVVFYDFLVEKGESDFSANGKIETLNDGANKKSVSAKWSILCRETKWVDFYISSPESKTKVLVKNPELAEGRWIYEKNQIPSITILPFKDVNDKIKNLILTETKKKRKPIEEGRYIRYLERSIKEQDDVLVYGNIEKVEDDSNVSYTLTSGKDGMFIITNDKNFDLLYEEGKHYRKGLAMFIFGLIGIFITFIWPYIMDIAKSSTIQN